MVFGFRIATLLLVVVGLTGCVAEELPLQRPAEPCSRLLPVSWRGETLHMEGSHPDLVYVDLDLEYRGVVIGEEQERDDLYGFHERGVPQQGAAWEVTRTFVCEDGRTDALSIIDDCTFPEPQAFVFDGMTAGWEQELDSHCIEFGWDVSGRMHVPECGVESTPAGDFEACALHWDLLFDFTPEDESDEPTEVLYRWSFAEGVGAIRWNEMVLTYGTLATDEQL